MMTPFLKLAKTGKRQSRVDVPSKTVTPEQVTRLSSVGRQYYSDLRTRGVPAIDAFNAAKGNMMDVPYDPRIRRRAIEEPSGHNFPRSVDKKMFEVPPVVVRGGSLGYAIQGIRNGSSVVFNVLVKNGKITHRDVIPTSQWEQRTRSFGWPGTLDDVTKGTINWPGK